MTLPLPRSEASASSIFVSGGAVGAQQVAGLALGAGQGQQEVLDRDVVVLHGTAFAGCGLEDGDQRGGEAGLGVPEDPGGGGQLLLQRLLERLGIGGES